ncbi:MAG: Eco57I restriction-modification methylase domain-containing protein [Candidatus Deferrimicrobium sp.]|nr:Eco57I restriction-modification methylase domain-containing protein [Candidatus Deferrimicrobium sp.]
MSIRSQYLGESLFPHLDPIQVAVDRLADAGIEERAAIFTRREVVEFILDLMGYTPAIPLHEKRILEPSFGDGDFLLVVVERLLAAYGKRRVMCDPAADLRDCVRGVELHRESYQSTREQLGDLLRKEGIPRAGVETLLDAWCIQGDFLLEPFPGMFSHVVGNPPYLRQEMIPPVLMVEYRRRFRTIYDRADIYVPFIERSLGLLEPGGVLGFICADRWMKNRYGGPLRRMVSVGYHLRHYVDMVDTPAFHSEVSAYPAITIIAREEQGKTRLAHRPEVNRKSLSKLATEMTGPAGSLTGSVKEVVDVAIGDAPWILESFDQLAVVRRLEATFPTMEEAGCRVGIGVATGADRVFIAPYETLDVEPDRKLPLVTTKDIASGVVRWLGSGVVNPFRDDGGLVDLRQYPKLAAYLGEHEELVRKRNVARNNPTNWFRTIDRIYPELARKPKLLIPDIKGKAHIVFEGGKLYPHHNLYYITSEEWNLRALRAVLLSGIARLFVSTYSTKMRGGFLRFQAQYLRRIRLPRWLDVPAILRAELVRVAETANTSDRDAAVSRLYGLSLQERAAIGGDGE